MIKIEQLFKTYEGVEGNFSALKNINLHIKEGECTLIKGHSGSGKSTLLSIIAGLLRPTSGAIEVDGVKLGKIPDHFASIFRREHIGFIFQKYNLIENLTVYENVFTPLIPSDKSYKESSLLVERALQIANISHKKENLIQNLSGGEQQRVAIARALANNPKIILADEPSANLDKKLTLEFIEEMENLKSLNKTILIASHDEILLSSSLFDKVISMEDGEIFW